MSNRLEDVAEIAFEFGRPEEVRETSLVDNESPLIQAIEEYRNVEVRIAVVKLLALSGQRQIIPAFRCLALRGSLPSEVRFGSNGSDLSDQHSGVLRARLPQPSKAANRAARQTAKQPTKYKCEGS